MTVSRVRRRLSWFLPENPDVLGMLRKQAQVTIEGMDALTAWAAGDEASAEAVRAKEHEADEVKRALRVALRVSFITPIGAEDIYVLSERLDSVMNGAKDAVRESEIMSLPPDQAMTAMSAQLCEGVRHLADAFVQIDAHGGGDNGQAATTHADEAIKTCRQLERVYRKAMSALVKETDLREVMGRRELYRRFSRISEDVAEVAERVWYASVKEA
jgi:uncharacterized protein Yka (UPF0111/DUF47 family)